MGQWSAYRRAVAIADRPELAAIARALTGKTGRPKDVPYRTAIIALLLHAIQNKTTMWLTEAADTLCALPATTLDRLGVATANPMNSIQDTITKLAAALERGLEVTYDDGTRQTVGVDDFTALVRLSQPGGYKISRAAALDGMDCPSWARRKDYVDPTTGEIRPSADPGAAIGHRTSTPNHENPWYVGYELHALCSAAEHGQTDEAPHLVIGLTVRPGNQDRAAAGTAAVLNAARYFRLDEVLADRGYTQLGAANFALPLRAAGIHTVHDLRANQRGVRASSAPGVVIIDGHPFVEAIPENLRGISPPQLGDPREKQEQARRLYDRRVAYAFTPHSRLDTTTGRQRFKGPARTGHLRCPNWPASMRLPRDRPMSTCKAGESCACGRVITLRLEDDAHLRQPWLYGTNDWKREYSRRVAIESVNAEARTHRGNINRGFTRVHGRARTAILLTFAYIGINIRIFHTWHEARGVDDPWSLAVYDPEDHRPRQQAANSERTNALRAKQAAGADPPEEPLTDRF